MGPATRSVRGAFPNFESHYHAIYGERWPALYEALCQPMSQYVARINRFALHGRTIADGVAGCGGGNQEVDKEKEENEAVALMNKWYPQARPLLPPLSALPLEQQQQRLGMPLCWVGERFPQPASLTFPTPSSSSSSSSSSFSSSSSSLHPYYLLDLASLLPVLALDIQPHHIIADLCASPGGKSLLLLEQLFSSSVPSQLLGYIKEQEGEGGGRGGGGGGGGGGGRGTRGHLLCNDRSLVRKERLKRTLREYVPEEVRRGQVKLLGQDARKWFGRREHLERYDRILVDAPCSSERHLLLQSLSSSPSSSPSFSSSSSLLDAWTASRTKRLASDQMALLSSALHCLKPGGRLVYATCSISPLENMGVVQRILRRNRRVFVVEEEEGEDEERGTGGGRALDVMRSFVEMCVAAKEMVGLERQEGGGWAVYPDVNKGWGPIYFCVLGKE